ncbi:MAG: hypothetical protein ABI602_03550 [Candidatus Saccharibacteria bacterium]
MKQKDIAIIIAVAGFSTVIAFVLANILLASPKNRQAEVKVLDSISSTFPTADKRYYNSTSIDPTQTVQIGNTTNSQPFNK